MSQATPVIESLLDTDLYKFTMWMPMLHRHPQTQAEYRFVSRSPAAPALSTLLGELNEQLDQLCSLRFTRQELDYLGALRYIKSDFVDFLRIFQFQRAFIDARASGDELQIVARGPQVHVTAFEVFVLAIVNELHSRRTVRPGTLDEGRARLQSKIARLREAGADAAQRRAHPFEFSDFGTRRRHSAAWQREVVGTLHAQVPEMFKGTSNVRLSRELGTVPIGTMGHEYLQTFQGLGVRLRDFQRAALEAWVQEYRGDLGIALTDVVGMDAFLSDFDLYFAKLFDGLRHDSGDPIAWGEKALAHYARLRIDAHSKRLVFSDSLGIERALALHRHFGDRTQVGFGIGTHLTNDVGAAPLNVVMKITSVNGQSVAKLSDSPGKTLCDDPAFLAYLKKVFAAAS